MMPFWTSSSYDRRLQTNFDLKQREQVMSSRPPRYHVDRVREYLRQGEGAPPPVFVGHQDILDDILRTAQESAGEAKFTRIIQGAPGAGKSSLLAEMQKRWLGKDGKPRVVALSSTDLMKDPRTGVGAVLDAWTMAEAKWTDTLKDRLKRLRGVGAGPGGLSVEFADSEVPGTCRELAARYPPAKEGCPVIVAVDESQRMDRGKTSPEALLLQEIHDSTSGLPLVPVLAGLSDTAARASEMHLTRGARLHEARPLTEFQARDFMRRLPVFFGLDTSRHNAHLEALAGLCDGWPRHLRQAGEVLARETERAKGDMHHMDWPAMQERTWTLRQEYYRKQTSRTMRRSRFLLAEILHGVPVRSDETTVTDVDILNHMNRIHNQHRDGEAIEWTLPRNRDAEWFLDHLIHQGALYEDGDGYIHSPIPSFKAFLIGRNSGDGLENDVTENSGRD